LCVGTGSSSPRSTACRPLVRALSFSSYIPLNPKPRSSSLAQASAESLRQRSEEDDRGLQPDRDCDVLSGLSGYETKFKTGELFDKLMVAGLRRRGWTESAIGELHKRYVSVQQTTPDDAPSVSLIIPHRFINNARSNLCQEL
jgi:hypothetical protein